MRTCMKCSIVGMLAVLWLLPAVGGQADPLFWNYVFSTRPNSGSYYGTCPLASDDYDAWDYAAAAGYYTYIAVYHGPDVDSAAWTGASGFYQDDFRAPITLIPGQSKTWTMYVWATTSLPADATGIRFNWWSDRPAPHQLSRRLTLKSKPVGITQGPDVGTTWDLASQPIGEALLPVFRTANGLDGYVFEFTATVIPEPSSLLALLAGVAGFGMMLRRRRRA